MAQPQLGNPTTTIDVGTWTVTGAATLAEALDEGLPGDDATSYAESVVNPVNETCKVGGLGVTDPGTDRGHRLRVKGMKTAAAPVVDLTAGLRKADGTLVAEATIQPTGTPFEWVSPLFSEAAISALVSADYPDLEIWVTANKVSGTNVRARLTTAQLEVPGDATFRSPPAGVTAGHTGYWTADGLSGFADTDPVDWLFDEDGEGRSFRQTVAANQPTYLVSVADFNGLAGISFRRAVARQFLRTNWSLVAQPFTWVLHLATRLPVPSDSSALLGADDLAADPDAFNLLLATTAEAGHPAAWGLNAEQIGAHIFSADNSRVDDVATVIAGEFNATSRIIHEGVELATGATGTDPSARYRLGDSEHTAQDRAGNLDFHCALWYPTTLTDTQLTDTSVALLAEAPAAASGGNRIGGTGAIRKPPRPTNR